MENEITSVLVESKIFLIRGKQVMIDRDLAELYGVETRAINQAVKRNLERFPEEFRFQLTNEEYEFLRSQFATLNEDTSSSRSQSVILDKDSESMRGKNLKYLPYVFTEQGVAMLSAVLHSPTAIQVSIRIMDAFVKLRHYVSSQIVKTDDKAELAEIRRLLLLHIDHCDKKFSEQDQKINQIIQVLNNLIEEPKSKRKIGFISEG
ncbi:ORF6N domain-containing protein [Treponema sp. C6A8]|uniref:ORF6N domain-containing protein n=1 Tax=Treponema sp. C6A8 TaxID=1410609 RepID=UPI000487FA3E|nr:ORF6N domain-containing protein [Treponema sp. C6A8]